MANLSSEILRKYGIWAIICSVIIAVIVAISVWVFAHNAAAPGGEVSILWGLAKYTKGGLPHESEQDLKARHTPARPEQSDSVPSQALEPGWGKPLTLDVRHNVTPQNLKKALNDLRAERHLRELTASESQRPVKEIPPGTFFFVYRSYLRSSGVLQPGGSGAKPDFLNRLSAESAARYSEYDLFVEIHHPEGSEPLVILYLDENSASQIATLSGTTQHTVMAAICPWGSMTSMASIPASRICSARPREMDVSPGIRVPVFDLVLR